MPLREDLLSPIPGDSPSGADLRYDPIYDKIKEARREEEDLNQGAWTHERKVADWPLVIRLTQEAIATRSKDLQLAVWLAEALSRKDGFGGLRQGIDSCKGLVEKFWDTLYPLIDDGDTEDRSGRLEYLERLEMAVKTTPIVHPSHGGYNLYQYEDSRKVGYKEQAKTPEQTKTREALVKSGKLEPEIFDKAFAETPKAMYAQWERDLDGSLESLAGLDKACKDRFGESSAPGFVKLRKALEDVRHKVHELLQEKRRLDPDPVEPEPKVDEARAEGTESTPSSGGGRAGSAAGILIPFASSEPADRRETIAAIARAAIFLRQREPFSPAAYLMMRGLRWGEVRAAAALSDPTWLEAPPTELRQHVKRLSVEKKWKELLETAENAMALPCSRAWLDLQRFVIEACVGLGSEYDAVAVAIRSELRSLLRDVPQLLESTLMDDTPAANPETQAWLRELLAEAKPGSETPTETPVAAAPAKTPINGRPSAAWQKKYVDSYTLALEAQRAGQSEKAVDIMNQEIAQLKSGRERFLRKLQLVEICIAAGKEPVAQPILDDLAAAVEAHKLDEWEDRQMVARALATIMRLSKKIQADAKKKQELFDRICRLDPVQALSC